MTPQRAYQAAVTAAAELPRLPDGVTMDPRWLAQAGCAGTDPEWFYPEPGDLRTEAQAKAVCATCPVRPECLAWALATRDAYAILGGLTPTERALAQRRAPTPLPPADLAALRADWSDWRQHAAS